MFTENELIKQEREVRKKLLWVAIPIVVMVIIITIWQNNSLEIAEEEYLRKRMKGYSGIIIKKYEEGDFPRARRHVTLNNYQKVNIHDYFYNSLSIGDSVVKKSGSDSIYFYLKNGRIKIIDELKWMREKYYALRSKED